MLKAIVATSVLFALIQSGFAQETWTDRVKKALREVVPPSATCKGGAEGGICTFSSATVAFRATYEIDRVTAEAAFAEEPGGRRDDPDILASLNAVYGLWTKFEFTKPQVGTCMKAAMDESLRTAGTHINGILQGSGKVKSGRWLLTCKVISRPNGRQGWSRNMVATLTQDNSF